MRSSSKPEVSTGIGRNVLERSDFDDEEAVEDNDDEEDGLRFDLDDDDEEGLMDDDCVLDIFVAESPLFLDLALLRKLTVFSSIF